MKEKEQHKVDGEEPSNANEEQQEQQPVSDFEQNGWKEHRDGEVVKLEPGNSISGLLIDKSTSSKYNNCGIYKLNVNDDPVPKVILGSKQLDLLMVTVDVGQEIKIVFTGTQPSDKGNPMKVFKVYTKD